jgi:hypothetical protein
MINATIPTIKLTLDNVVEAFSLFACDNPIAEKIIAKTPPITASISKQGIKAITIETIPNTKAAILILCPACDCCKLFFMLFTNLLLQRLWILLFDIPD